MKKAFGIIIFLLFVSFSAAYRPGDTITYRVVCHYDNGTVDTGCTKPSQERIYFPDGSVMRSNNLSEIDEANAPGLWAGNFTFSNSSPPGTYGVYITLVNSNFTQAATVLSYPLENLATEANLSTVAQDIKINATQAQTDTATILANTITLSSEHTSLGDGISRNSSTINISIIANLSNDFGFFDPLFLILNSSVLQNISQSAISSSVSSADRISIGEQCAIQSFRQNSSVKYIYNLSENSSFELLNIFYNYTNLDIFINETYFYNNLSILNETWRNASNG